MADIYSKYGIGVTPESPKVQPAPDIYGKYGIGAQEAPAMPTIPPQTQDAYSKYGIGVQPAPQPTPQADALAQAIRPTAPVPGMIPSATPTPTSISAPTGAEGVAPITEEQPMPESNVPIASKTGKIIEDTGLGAFSRAYTKNIAPTAAGLQTAKFTAKVATKIPGGPVAKFVGAFVGGLGGYFGASYFANQLQDKAIELSTAKNTNEEIARQLAADAFNHPIASKLGEIATTGTFIKPSAKNVGDAFKTLKDMMKSSNRKEYARSLIASKPDAFANMAGVLFGGATGAVDAIEELATQPLAISAPRSALAILSGFILNKTSPVGKALQESGEWQKAAQAIKDATGVKTEAFTGKMEAGKDLQAKKQIFKRGQEIAEAGAEPVPEVTEPTGKPVTAKEPVVSEAKGEIAKGKPVTPTDSLIGGTLRKIKSAFSSTEGVAPELYNAYQKARDTKAASEMTEKIAFKTWDDTVNALMDNGVSQEVATKAIDDLQKGNISYDDFATAVKETVPNADPLLTDIAGMAKVREANRLAISKAEGIDPDLAKTIAENEYYQTRIYDRWLNKKFVPSDANYNNAMVEVANSAKSNFDELSKIKGINVQKLIDGDESGLADLSPWWQGKVKGYLDDVKSMQDAVEFEFDATGDIAKYRLDMKKLGDYAKGTVDYYLGKRDGLDASPDGGPSVTKLQHRILNDVFRKLYGEIDMPQVRDAYTAGVQERLIAQQNMMDEIVKLGAGKEWSTSASPTLNRQVPNQPKKYGRLAGKYISQELHDLLIPSGKKHPFLDAWQNTQSIMRLGKLYGGSTIARNYLTSVIGFANASGDTLEKGFWGNFGKAHKIMAGLIRGNKESMEIVRTMAKNGVFTAEGNQMLTGITDDTVGGKVGSLTKQLGKMYAYIDFPAKYAAYMTQFEKGKRMGLDDMASAQRAIDHVKRFYQRSQSVPRVVKTMSKYGITDFPGYVVDSTRIYVNALKHAGEQAKLGNFKPMIGIGLATAIPVIGTTTYSKIKDDGEIDLDRQNKFRDALPDYAKNSLLDIGMGKDKNGNETIRYSTVGSMQAFPVMSIIMGAMQRAGGDKESFAKEFATSIGQQLRQQFAGGGMLPKAAIELATGNKLGTTMSWKGLLDIKGHDYPSTLPILTSRTKTFLKDVFGGRVGAAVIDAIDIENRKQRGEKEVPGSYKRIIETSDLVNSLASLITTQEVNQYDYDRLLMNKMMEDASKIREAKTEESRLDRETAKTGYVPTEAERAYNTLNNNKVRVDSLGRIIASLTNAKGAMPQWYPDKKINAMLDEPQLGFNVIEKKYIRNKLVGKEVEAKPIDVKKKKPGELMKYYKRNK